MSERSPEQAGAALVLFTRDLRVRDNVALATAAREHERVVPLFVLDRAILAGSAASPNRLRFLLDCLRGPRRLAARARRATDRPSRRRRRGGRCGVADERRVTSIHMSDDVTPYARERRERLARACRSSRVELVCHPGVTIVPAGEIVPGGGDHYRVFTPYWRVWSSSPPGQALRAPARLSLPGDVRSEPIPELTTLTQRSASPTAQPGGESAARRRLERWLGSGASSYAERRDDLAQDATSRLSPYLHFGCVSPRTVLERGAESGADEAFARQLCWRDFHHQVLAARPTLPREDYRPRGDRWRRDEQAASAWRDGRTGYPIVDAGMRQLAEEGFIHNRARLIVGSFLTKTLYIDWRVGAAHFASLLLDADVANNVGNWQWVAGTGNDTRPNRVLNPIRQAHRFDPHGDYVRRYVPELAGVSGGAVHEPWRLGAARRALDYPQPLVDHEQAAREFRALRVAHDSEPR